MEAELAAAIREHGMAIYPLLFLLVALEIGVAPLFFLPGDPLLFLCGALTVQGGLETGPLIGVFFVATLLGNALAYSTGAWIALQARQRDWRWLEGPALARARKFFAGHGGWGLVVVPYVAVLRTFAPVAAGLALMDRRRFALATLAAAALWSVGLVAAGRYFGQVPLVREHLGVFVLSGVALAAVGAVLKRLLRRSSDPV
ncbi:DedA family protein [Pelomonas sp. KK5]|uniref:DedA family protein n=1 Tax=Pelomonas sp. KK5 TaxID=1855730 RepID=UPI00097BB946|nr:DedA family protein [Pelomonas sp. KK5]